ncbi:flagellar export chaperone FliS [Sporosalibacterium faouarense]|uniref:flagellar export chaperone FliS n=1 Tax=Sporosalibacterium faouarense TaxID=516123 RepID=UPI00141C90E2|nr:flagellar export chaperone FliS [Sporosalibacterium faouarense]MTI46620.1 flagellar export chaperone FliS [Bacillota bacterium]
MAIELENLTEKILLEKSPQEITSILYKGCIEKLKISIEAIEDKDYEKANKLLQKCNDIIYRLGAGLKYEVGPIADQLDNLYNYMAEELIQANIKKDVDSVRIVLRIMRDISKSWDLAMEKGIDREKVNKNILKYDQNSIGNPDSDEGFQYQK